MELPHSDPRDPRAFVPETLDKSVISIPLLKKLKEEDAKGPDAPREVHPVIIDVNLEYREGAARARERVKELLRNAIEEKGGGDAPQGIDEEKTDLSQQYVFAHLQANVIREIVRLDNEAGPSITSEAPGAAISHRSIYRIWPDFPVNPLISKTVSTVKADAAMASFAAFGQDIVWAVMDSGIQADHPHFEKHKTLELPPPLDHADFTGMKSPLVDGFGHGTHVAGIIAGAIEASPDRPIRALTRHRDENGEVAHDVVALPSICGMAPKCRLVSLKVLDDKGLGSASNMIAAIEYVQQINGYGRRLRIHGINMSVGYDFEPEWFACGQSPLCVEVDRLVRSGVVVVVAAGNTGYGWHQSAFRGAVAAGMDLTINDPGNAELAITVGSTHRDMPHVYGVSYFSSKGPTGDGRLKPDLVAPGEKILSCAAGSRLEDTGAEGGGCEYVEDSGTSMAAPHVSGVIASFLSIRTEFIGRPDAVKEIFLTSATDLKRERTFQGYGLVDLMRAIQSV